LKLEMDAIASLLTTFPFITIDTEYAGAVHRPSATASLAPRERYVLVESNVDEVPIVQLGITLTLCDEHGNLPVLFDGHGRRPFELAWEMTFSDFDARRDRHAPDSVAFLRSQGIDFDQARASGVSSAAFAARLAAVLSSATPQRCQQLTWVAFGGAYDFAYMVKMLAGGRPLPATWHEFVAQAKALLGGGRVFDAKYMAEHCERVDLCGGLRRVAASLGVRRNVSRLPYLAAQKSHTACLIYTAMRRVRDGCVACAMLEGLIDGLQR
jgi:CCR4-NOT transcription complex subunit 7/8